MISKERSIVFVLLIPLILIVTLALGIFGLFNYTKESARLNSEMQFQANSSTEQLANALALPIWNFDDELIEKIIESRMLQKNIYAIELWIPAKSSPYFSIKRDSLWRVIHNDQKIVVNENHVYEKSIYYSNEKIGTVKLYITDKFLKETQKEYLLTVLLNIVYTDIPIVLILSVLIWFIIINPLKVVEKYAGSIVEGKPISSLNRIGVTSKEINHLETSLTAMVNILQEKISALKTSEEMFRKIFEASPSAVTLSSWETKNFIDCNPAFEKTFGYSKEEILNKTPDELNIWEDTNLRDLLVEEFEKTGFVSQNEIGFVTKNGNLVKGEAHFIKLNISGKPCALSIMNDITERLKAEDKLKRSESNLNALINSTNDLIWSVDLDFKITTFNENLNQHFQNNYGTRCFVGGLSNNFLPQDKAVLWPDFYKRALNEGAYKIEYSLTDEKILELSFNPVINEGKAIGVSVFGKDITEIKLAAEALRRSEEEYRKLITTIPDIIIKTDLDGNIIFINESSAPLWGYAFTDSILGRNLFEFLDKKDRERAKTNFEERKNLSLSMGLQEYDLIGLNNEKINCEVNGNILRDADDKPYGIVFIIRNITERKKAELTAKETEIRFKTLFENANDAILIIEDGIFIECNSKATEIFGCPKDKLIGKPPTYFSPELQFDNRNSQVVAAEKISAACAGVPQRFEWKHLHYDKTPFDAEVTLNCIELGKNIYLQAIVRDITDRVKVQKELLNEKTFNQSINEQSPNIIYIYDVILNKNIYCNKNLSKYLGYSEIELTDNDPEFFTKVIHPEDIKQFDNYYKKVTNWEHQYVFEFEYRVRTNDGTWRWFKGKEKEFQRDKDFKIASILGTVEDITESKLAGLELERYKLHLEDLVKQRTHDLELLNQQLEIEVIKEKEAEEKVKLSLEKEKELSELKTKFISITSHEFRTPLTSVYSSAQLIERYSKKWSDEERQKHIDRIKKSVKYLTRLLDDVLTISRAESGKIKFEPKKSDLAKLCSNIVDDIKLQLTDKHDFKFSIQLNNNYSYIDEKLITFILINLLSNAIKYSINGGQIRLDISEESGEIIFKIADQGIGIPLEDQSQLFEPFNRAKNVGNISGTGLGMSIVKRSVDMHHGSIAFESKENIGTTFTVRIPIKSEYNYEQDTVD